MKRLPVLLLAFLLATSCFAQEVVITIEDCGVRTVAPGENWHFDDTELVVYNAANPEEATLLGDEDTEIGVSIELSVLN